MNALEAIVRTLEAVAPEYQIHVGFAADIDFWLQENVGNATMIFVSVQGDTVTERGEDGIATAVESTFAIWIKRISIDPADAARAYDEYRTLRAALNGVEYDGGILTLTGGIPAVGAGYVNSQFQLETIGEL